jgi:putative adhesin
MRMAGRVSGSLLLLCASAAVWATNDTTFERVVPAQPRGVVDISNVAGLVEVSGWDRAEVSVRAELGSQVERVDVTSEGSRTTIKVVLPEHSGHRAEVQLHVQIPKDSELDVSAVSADIHVSGVAGVLRLNAVSGDVTSELGATEVEAKTVSGDIRLKGHGQGTRLTVSSVSGDVRVERGAGDFEANTVSGTLQVSLDSARSIRARSTSGDLRFEAKLARGATVEATSVSGELSLRASADGGYAYEVSSFSGDISDCFDVKAERTSQYAPGRTLQGTRGEGAGHVRLKTMSGDVQLCDRP